MKNQNNNEFEKKEDDFDFFKKPGNINLQKEIEQKHIESQEKNTKLSDKLISYFQVKSNIKKLVFITFSIALPISVGLMLNAHNTKAPVVVNHPALVKTSPTPIVIEATPGKNPEDPPNIDYSKVSKEDGERIKQALQQFHDITKQLKDTSKDINEQKK